MYGCYAQHSLSFAAQERFCRLFASFSSIWQQNRREHYAKTPPTRIGNSITKSQRSAQDLNIAKTINFVVDVVTVVVPWSSGHMILFSFQLTWILGPTDLHLLHFRFLQIGQPLFFRVQLGVFIATHGPSTIPPNLRSTSIGNLIQLSRCIFRDTIQKQYLGVS